MDKYILKVWRGLRNEITFILSPTEKWGTKTEYTKLKKFLHKDGYLRIAPEVYMRIVQNRKASEKHFRRIEEYAPKTGTVRLLRLTEKQYNNIYLVTGEPDYQEKIVGTKNMDSEYLFQITDNNNLYVSVQYDISLDKQNTMSISYDYDLSKESQLQFEYHLNDIQQLDDGYQQLNQQVTKINQIITLFNEKDNQELIQKTLNDLKNNEAEISKETLSHYGKGMTQSKGNDQSSIRIFNYKDTYRLKFSYDSNLNLEKFI